MFITSAEGNGNLSTWPGAGGLTGLAAADAICQARATAAALPNASGYRAWLSDSADDAYCRMHNLTGKRASNCGLATLPASAGPWWRTDALPFGAALPGLLSPVQKVLTPPSRDESQVRRSANAWTGTTYEGADDGSNCLNWTSAAPGEVARIGNSDFTSWNWTSMGMYNCNLPSRLYCFETGAGDPFPPFPAWGRLAFLTSAHGPGELGSWPAAGAANGLAAGDQICRTLAGVAGIRQPDSFKAWLSNSGFNAIDRFQHDGAWMRLDGMPIAQSLADLADNSLETSISLTETGSYLDYWAVWTGTLSDGTVAASHCLNWSSGVVSDAGDQGIANASHLQWTQFGVSNCDFQWSYLYCLQDLPLIFLDSFESHGTQAWTNVVP